jgi:hypothetical protein
MNLAPELSFDNLSAPLIQIDRNEKQSDNESASANNRSAICNPFRHLVDEYDRKDQGPHLPPSDVREHTDYEVTRQPGFREVCGWLPVLLGSTVDSGGFFLV